MENQNEPIDRTGWPVGPWDNEPDDIEWRSHGLPCLIKRVPLSGHLCGYVAVPPGHPAHEADYDDVDVLVHGGLTYGRKCQGRVCHVPEPGEPADVYWLGFDCAHAWDMRPSHPTPEWHDADWTYKTVEFVTAECESLAEQLAKMGGE